MSSTQKKIEGGVYLVLDPAMEKSALLSKLKETLEAGVSVVQIWNHWPDDFTTNHKKELVEQIVACCSPFEVPVLINDEWELVTSTDLYGVHFDEIPEDFEDVIAEIGNEAILGITCSNNLEVIRWAEEHDFDYISFCALFPSPSVSSCEIVRPETIRKAREITQKPLFVSGGITAENLTELNELDINGVAVISGILGADSPGASTRNYTNALKTLRAEK